MDLPIIFLERIVFFKINFYKLVVLGRLSKTDSAMTTLPFVANQS